MSQRDGFASMVPRAGEGDAAMTLTKYDFFEYPLGPSSDMPRRLLDKRDEGRYYLVADVEAIRDTDAFIRGLPKSEYVPCEPPERWVDVTKDVRVRVSGSKNDPYIESGEFVCHELHDIAKLICGGRYRLRKVQGKALMSMDYAFVVEKREP